MTIPVPLSAFNYLSPSPANTNIQEFTLSGIWRKPAGCSMVMVELWGGGGAGGGANVTAYVGSGGGGGGSYSMKMLAAKSLPQTVRVVIGAGGVGSAAAAGGSGGSTFFGDGVFSSTVNPRVLNYYVFAGGGAGGNSIAQNNGRGGFGGGVISSTVGVADGSNATGIPGYPYASSAGGGHFGGSNANTGSGNGTVRFSVWGGGGGDYGGNNSDSGGGVSQMGGCGGGSGGVFVTASLPTPGTNGGGAFGFLSGGGGLGMSGAVTAGRNGGPREGGGGGAPGSGFGANGTVQRILVNSNVALMSGGPDFQSYQSTSITANPTRSSGHNGITKIVFNGSQYIGISGRSTSNYMSSIFVSSNGLSWTVLNTQQIVLQSGGSKIYANIMDIEFANGVYVGVFNTDFFNTFGTAYSYDLNTWIVSGTNTLARQISVANNVFYVTSATSSATVRSTDGITWTTPAGLSGVATVFVAGNGGTAVVVQSTGTSTYISTDNGLNFSVSATTAVGAVNSSSSSGYHGGLAWNSTLSLWCLVGASSIYTSPDGNTWTLQTDGSTDNFSGVGSGLVNGINYFVVGSVSTTATLYLYSTNGTAWTIFNSSITGQNAGNGGNGGFPAAGGGGGGQNGGASTIGGRGGNGFARITCW